MTEKTEPQSASEPSGCELCHGTGGRCPHCNGESVCPNLAVIANLRAQLEAAQAESAELKNNNKRLMLSLRSAESQLRVAREALEKIICDGETIEVECSWCDQLCDDHFTDCPVTVAKKALAMRGGTHNGLFPKPRVHSKSGVTNKERADHDLRRLENKPTG